MAGYVKLHRGWANGGFFKDEPFTEREAWIWLIENAAWKDHDRTTPHGVLMSIKRGQIHTSDRALSKAWKWDRKRVSRFIKRLENGAMVRAKSDPLGTLITVCNYDKYQGDGATDGATHGATHGATDGATHGATQEERIRNKEGKNTDYAFSGAVVRLNRADFDRWQKAYPDLDLTAMLTSRDDWLSGQPEDARKRWFQSTSSWLGKQQQDAKERKPKAFNYFADVI